MTPILDHTKRSRPPVQPCDAPSIDPAPRRLRVPEDSPRPRSGNVMAGFRAGTSGRTASRRAQAGRSRSDAHRNRASGAGSMRRARPNRPPGAARVLVSLTGTLTPESLLAAVISAIGRGQQLLRVVIGHLASSSVVAGHAAPIGSAWPPSAWHRGPCPCGHYALPGDAALNHAAYYRHVVAP